MTITVQVRKVNIPAWSTIGYGEGVDEATGHTVSFIGDHRPLRQIGEAISEAHDDLDLPYVTVEAYQITSISE